mgnify:CR=1 FL=1|jgi:hypothetical protein
MALVDRLKWIRDDLKKQRGESARKISTEIGRDPTWLSTTIDRFLKNPDKNPNSVELDTLLRLAAYASVSPNWLLLDQGLPRANEPELQTRFEYVTHFGDLPNIESLVESARQIPSAQHYEPWVWDEVRKARMIVDGMLVTPHLLVIVAQMIVETIPAPATPNPTKKPSETPKPARSR